MNKMQLEVLDIRAINNILEIKGSSADLLQKLIVLYREESPELMNKIARGIDNADPAEIRAGSHSLKSTSATLGALKLADCAKALELMASKSDIDNALAVFNSIESEHQLVLADLNTLMKEIQE